jgi:glycosyltransferase involved in cell wall biosynthesis
VRWREDARAVTEGKMMKAEPYKTCISIGILAWNEADSIETTLESLFQQSLFAHLEQRRLDCEVICVANGCTDNTAALAAKLFRQKAGHHPARGAFACRTVSLPERGKVNAWNLFIHALSSKSARFLFVMDADILITKPDTLWNMYGALLDDSEANVAVDQPLKDIAFKTRKSLIDRVSLTASEMTQADGAQLTGQLYCIRADVARNIHLPRDLAACEDGFIKTIVCTDFLNRPSNPRRVIQAKEAAHVFEAYTSVGAVLRNQKRQMIGQTMVHVLAHHALRGLAQLDRADFASCLRQRDAEDSPWLKRLVSEHLDRTKYFWRLFPGILTFRLKRWAKLRGFKKLSGLPVALAGLFVTLVACWMARRFLMRGHTDYWPDTRSPGLKELRPTGDATGASQPLDTPALQH